MIQSAPVETCSDMARLALDDALLWIDERYGEALESLRWGDAHQASHDHEVLGDIGWIGWLVNIRQSTSGGDNTLQRAMSAGIGPDPFLNVHGARDIGASTTLPIPTARSLSYPPGSRAIL